MAAVFFCIAMENTLITRFATVADAADLLAIYAPYVERTAITFEYEIPSIEEFMRRISNTLKKYPYVVACQKEKIVGYAYASSFKDRAAYAWSVETSIYVDKSLKRTGVGGLLHRVLEKELKKRGFLNMNACIAYPECEDEYLTRDSVEFHKYMGYRWVGEFTRCGYKFGRWYNMVWMEKLIGQHKSGQEAPRYK